MTITSLRTLPNLDTAFCYIAIPNQYIYNFFFPEQRIHSFLDFFFSFLPPSAPHLGCLTNEKDIPEEVTGSEEQLNGGTGEIREPY